MSAVESAASLFGGVEAGPDPFAALGSDESQPAPSQSPEHTESYPDSKSEAASNLFGEDQYASSAQTWDPTATDAYQYEAASYPQPENAQAPYQGEGWYDQHGQWQTQWPTTQHVDPAPVSAGAYISVYDHRFISYGPHRA